MASNIRNIVFSAGSMGGITFVGAYKALEEAGIAADITNYSGCSIGSVMAFLVSIGYTGEELETLALAFRYHDIADFQVLHTFDNLGLETGNEVEHLLRELLYRKTGRYDITFSMHYTITGRNLWINASCVEHDCAYYFSRFGSPDMDIIRAVRMSISLPLIMAPVKYRGLTFIDGGFHDPCPFGMFRAEHTLVLRVKNSDSSHENQRNDFTDYIGQIFQSVYKRLYVELDHKLASYAVVQIESGISSISLDIKKSIRKKLIRLGHKRLKAWTDNLLL